MGKSGSEATQVFVGSIVDFTMCDRCSGYQGGGSVQQSPGERRMAKDFKKHQEARCEESGEVCSGDITLTPKRVSRLSEVCVTECDKAVGTWHNKLKQQFR